MAKYLVFESGEVECVAAAMIGALQDSIGVHDTERQLVVAMVSVQIIGKEVDAQRLGPLIAVAEALAEMCEGKIIDILQKARRSDA